MFFLVTVTVWGEGFQDQGEWNNFLKYNKIDIFLQVTEEKYLEAAAQYLEAKDGTEKGKTVSI